MRAIRSYFAGLSVVFFLINPILLVAADPNENCGQDLTEVNEFPFVSPFSEIEGIASKLPANEATWEFYREKHLPSQVGFRTEPIPVGADAGFFALLELAAKQRAHAMNALFADIYSPKSGKPEIFKKHPLVKRVIESSPHYFPQLVSSNMARHTTERNEWDFCMAMDWVVLKNNPGPGYRIELAENDTGAIGGDMRMAMLDQAMRDLWGDEAFKGYRDARTYLPQLLAHVASKARAYGTGKPLLYTEADVEFALKDPKANNHLANTLRAAGMQWASTWNRDQLHFDVQSGLYKINGQVITANLLAYYGTALDPSSPFYLKELWDDREDDGYEWGHAVHGYWNNYMNGGYAKWYQFNPMGIEVFTDKGLAALMDVFVEFYLNEKPRLRGDNYSLFVQADGKIDDALHRKVLRHKDNWVVKSRLINGQGKGTYVGAEMSLSGWEELLATIQDKPVEWVAQPFFTEELIEVPRTGKRSFEGRNIVFFYNGEPHVIPTIYIRSNKPGLRRNMSGGGDATRTASIVPVMVSND